MMMRHGEAATVGLATKLTCVLPKVEFIHTDILFYDHHDHELERA